MEVGFFVPHCPGLYDTGNPDHYADNLYMYHCMARSDVRRIMYSINDPQVQDLLRKQRMALNPFNEEELHKMFKIVPVRAQREGNLLTITYANQQLFERLCDEAYAFAEKYFSKQPLRDFFPKKEVEVYWWEKGEDKERFQVPAKEKKVEKKPPSSFREALLREPEPKPKLKKRAKPSRLRLLIYFDEKDTEGKMIPLVRKESFPKGIIYWTNSLDD